MPQFSINEKTVTIVAVF